MFRRIQLRYQRQVIFANIIRITLHVGLKDIEGRISDFIHLIDGTEMERINCVVYFDCCA